MLSQLFGRAKPKHFDASTDKYYRGVYEQNQSIENAYTYLSSLAFSGRFDKTILRNIHQSLVDCGDVENYRVKYLLASLYLQINELERVREIMTTSGKVHREMRYFGALLIHARDTGYVLPDLPRRDHEALDYLQQHCCSAEHWAVEFAQPVTGYAVVGNAPGKAFEEELGDYCKIHFNDYQTNQRITGLADLHVVTPSWKPSQRPGGTHLCITGNNIFHRRSRVWQKISVCKHYESVITLPRELWSNLLDCLQAPPSAGMCAMQCLADCFPLVDRRVFIGGFSCGVPTNNHAYDHSLPSQRHDWGRESSMRAQTIERIRKMASSVTIQES